MLLFDRMGLFQKLKLSQFKGPNFNQHSEEILKRFEQVDYFLLPLVSQLRRFMAVLTKVSVMILIYFIYFDVVKDNLQDGIGKYFMAYVNSDIDKPVKKANVKFSDIIVYLPHA